MNNQHIQNIIKANDDNRLAIFVGAGISKYSETSKIRIPLWSDLIKKIQQDLDEHHEQDYLKLAQLYYLEFGEFSYYQMLKEFFSSNLEPSEIHKLIFQIKPQYVITTNWDDILEKTVSEYNSFYDLVVSDEDLVKSTMQKKLIKMHGDFKHHNIVFKEDDYLNYSHNFPLTENFIRSILSTHTVLFIGYSYNDYNLKQITKWIQSFSKVKPPAYLVEFKYNESRAKYLENHGITLLSINSNNGIDDRFTNMKKFLESIKNKQINEASAQVDYATVIDYFYNQLLPYDSFTVLMPEQVRNCFKYAKLHYINGNTIILDFFKVLDDDKHNARFQEILKIFDKHVEKNKTEADELFLAQNSRDLKLILENKDKLEKIFTILSKAGFAGVMLDDKSYYKFDLPFYDGINLDNIITFKLNETVARDDLERALVMHELDKDQIAYDIYDKLIKNSMKHQDYYTAFIGMFNSNNIRHILQWDYRIADNKYKNIEDYDLEDKYYDLPKVKREDVHHVFDQIRDFKFLYKNAFEISSLLDDKIKSKQYVLNGGMTFSNEAEKPQVKHCNLMYFVLGNGIAVEKYNEFLRIMTYFIKIAVIRQFQQDDIQLNKLELYSCIRYIKYEDLKDIFADCDKKDTKQKLIIDDELSNYLLSVLENLENHLLGSQNIPFPNFEAFWINLLYIFSIIKIEDSTLARVLTNFNKILSSSNNSMSIYEAINLFFGLQYQLYKMKIDVKKLFDLLEVLINKIVYKTYNWHEYEAISRNYVSNLYSYISLDVEKKYDNEKLIDKLIAEINYSCDIKQQVQFSKYFLINLLSISNSVIQDKIKHFICSIDINNLEDNFEKLDTNLFLFSHDLTKVSKESIKQDFENYMQQFRNGSIKFSSDSYTIYNWLDYLVNTKKIEEFNNLLNEVKSLIDNFKSPVQSFF